MAEKPSNFKAWIKTNKNTFLNMILSAIIGGLVTILLQHLYIKYDENSNKIELHSQVAKGSIEMQRVKGENQYYLAHALGDLQFEGVLFPTLLVFPPLIYPNFDPPEHNSFVKLRIQNLSDKPAKNIRIVLYDFNGLANIKVSVSQPIKYEASNFHDDSRSISGQEILIKEIGRKKVAFITMVFKTNNPDHYIKHIGKGFTGFIDFSGEYIISEPIPLKNMLQNEVALNMGPKEPFMGAPQVTENIRLEKLADVEGDLIPMKRWSPKIEKGEFFLFKSLKDVVRYFETQIVPHQPSFKLDEHSIEQANEAYHEGKIEPSGTEIVVH